MFYIVGFYKFKKIDNVKKLKDKFQKKLVQHKIKGSIIFSKEGINGTISGKKNDILIIINNLKRICKINKFDSQNTSINSFQPFHRAKVKIKKEVVPLGIKVKQSQRSPNLIEPNRWNKLLSEKKVKIIDVRKPFEYEVGTFRGAKNPNVKNFRDFPKYFEKFDKKNKIAMFCTGGIRCEKASAYLKNKGFKNIFQLKGGILNYLNQIDKSQSMWKGECYVFDNRVSLKHKLKVGSYSICSGCRMPISIQNKKSNKYLEGVSCPRCHDNLTDTQRARFSMRQKQIVEAKKLGKKYIFQKEFF